MRNVVDEYLDLATQWSIAMSEGDSARSNAIHDHVQQLYKMLVDAGEEESLFRRMDDVNDAVRFFIASHLKERDSQRALLLYQQLIESELPFIAISSRYILREMEK